MPVYKTKSFARFARGEDIDDANLLDAIARTGDGLIDADLGGGLIKQRVARRGQGRRGGYRVLIAFRSRDFAVLLYGFAKSQRENLEHNELRTLQSLAAAWFAAGPDVISRALMEGRLIEAGQ